MEIRDASSMMGRAEEVGSGAKMAQLHPSGPVGQGHALLAVDLLEIEPGGSTRLLQYAEEHLLFVIAGTGELKMGTGGDSGVSALLRPNAVVYVGPREAHQLSNTGSAKLRVLVSTPLIAYSDRALGVASGNQVAEARPPMQQPEAGEAVPPVARARPEKPAIAARGNEPTPTPQKTPPQPEEAPLPDISGLMRASDLPAGPKPERRRPEPMPQSPAIESSEAEAEEDTEDAEEEGHKDLMELMVVFDGGSRGNPGQGYGSYLVQSPGRKPVIKRVEFGDNYTNNQAEYSSLIACLQYIIERLQATNRQPSAVALDIKSDSEDLVNQLQGVYKVKDAGLKQRYAQAMDLLAQFGAWLIDLHSHEEGVKLLGH